MTDCRNDRDKNGLVEARHEAYRHLNTPYDFYIHMRYSQ